MAELRRLKNGVLQQKSKATRGFTKRKRIRFLDELAATCNVERASAAAGINSCTVYRTCKRDAEFARLYAEALKDGHRRIEAELLMRALDGAGDGENPHRDELADPPARVAIDTKLALAMLARRDRDDAASGRRERGFRRATQAEADGVLLKRLAALEKRLGLPPLPPRPLPPALPAPSGAPEPGDE